MTIRETQWRSASMCSEALGDDIEEPRSQRRRGDPKQNVDSLLHIGPGGPCYAKKTAMWATGNERNGGGFAHELLAGQAERGALMRHVGSNEHSPTGLPMIEHDPDFRLATIVVTYNSEAVL